MRAHRLSDPDCRDWCTRRATPPTTLLHSERIKRPDTFSQKTQATSAVRTRANPYANMLKYGTIFSKNTSMEVLQKMGKKIKSINDVLKELNYLDRPEWHLVMGCIPLATPFHSALLAGLRSEENKKFKLLYQQLSNGEIYLTEELINNNEFIYAFNATTRAVLATSNHDKIKYISELFKNYCDSKESVSFEDHEEWLSILNELSCRELQILVALTEYSNQITTAEEIKSLYVHISEKLKIEYNEIEGRLFRLQRTGLCVNQGGFDGGFFELRPNFYSFLKAIGIEQDI